MSLATGSLPNSGNTLRPITLATASVALAAAPAVILEIVGNRLCDGVGAGGHRAMAGGKPLLLAAPRARGALRLREVEDGFSVGVLQVVGKPELALAVGRVVVSPARDPRAAGGAPAVAEVQALFDRPPVRLGSDGEAQARAAGGEGSFTDGAGHDGDPKKFLPTFCLISVGKPPRTSRRKFNGKARKI